MRATLRGRSSSGTKIAWRRTVVDPSQRLVASTLERRWNDSLLSLEELCVVIEPGMHRSSLHGNREISGLATRPLGWSASGRRGAIADDERVGEVRLRRSSGEVGERR